MSANSVQYFIRSILQNSKLNREKFVNNKKKYNMITIQNRNHNMIIKNINHNMIIKNRNHNMIIKRNFGLLSGFIPPNSNDPNKDPDYFRTVVALIIGTYIVTYIVTNRQK
jgi:hypothetical protein